MAASFAQKYLQKLLVLKGGSTPSISKAMVIRINLFFLALFLLVYALLLLLHQPSAPDHNIRSSIRGYSYNYCSMLNSCKTSPKAKEQHQGGDQAAKIDKIKRVKPAFADAILMQGKKGNMKIGMINMEDEDLKEWEQYAEMITIEYDKVSELFEWKHLFPEWIDEEQENEGGYICPEIPMPIFEDYYSFNFDLIMVKIPCGSNLRDVFRLQLHLMAAKMALVFRYRRPPPRVVVLSKCRPMMEIFRCDDLVSKEGDWWLFEPDMGTLENKLSLPIGSCNLALPLNWSEEENNEIQQQRKSIMMMNRERRREAYATVLHSSEAYVCGAITLAQSLIQTGTKRDLLLLLDTSISIPKREALAMAGWKIHLIKRIRNPKAEKNSYNEYNYSKFRLWQLTQYSKIIFVDSDIIVLQNLDLLFRFPQMSAAGNDGSLFNSGVMVIEPSNCTFRVLMKARKDVVSYNGGDQGFLNEIFVYWHRLPRRVNFLKNFWSNSSSEAHLKNNLFGADPPKLYAIHYLGLKPWLCYRDYDCNFDIEDQLVYASDVAHKRWWKVHDAMDAQLQSFCGLSPQRNNDLKWDRMNAMRMALPGAHWNITLTDPRRLTAD
ncbi:UDP-glucuronate:xylan alpha-glucuronosyltransferase 2 [Impatiens glandulifera]|uniref:UDP-glucuronate:xylan alpha-glucuronosyltransferase 2 n=1 Tax=Impatiens glandulifera TaxID=253017 RepID=UPI001FB1209B|nr:UDP-glucuronate:xylan alpha-glucuronosyltransferase 2 [Impatiens glandulifera]